MKLLIAYDGSECTDLALKDLTRAGLPAIVEALVVVVTEMWLPPPPPSGFEVVEATTGVTSSDALLELCGEDSEIARESQELAARAATLVKKQFPQWVVETKIRCGSPAGELLAEADEWKPDLILVGSHGRTAIGRAVIGSVSQKLVMSAQCSVRVARGHVDDSSTRKPLRLILGLDGSSGSQRAVSGVAQRHWQAGAEIRLVTSTAPFREYWPSTRVQLKHLEAMQQSAAALLKPAGLTVSSKIDSAEPKRLLVSEAAGWDSDCIFVGATGHTFLDRLLLGSVAAAVVVRAHCSVEVIR